MEMGKFTPPCRHLLVCFFFNWPTSPLTAYFHHMPRAGRKEPICVLGGSSKQTQQNTQSRPRRATAGLARGYGGAAARGRGQRRGDAVWRLRGRAPATASDRGRGERAMGELHTGVRAGVQAGAPARRAPGGSKHSDTTGNVFEKS